MISCSSVHFFTSPVCFLVFCQLVLAILRFQIIRFRLASVLFLTIKSRFWLQFRFRFQFRYGTMAISLQKANVLWRLCSRWAVLNLYWVESTHGRHVLVVVWSFDYLRRIPHVRHRVEVPGAYHSSWSTQIRLSLHKNKYWSNSVKTEESLFVFIGQVAAAICNQRHKVHHRRFEFKFCFLHKIEKLSKLGFVIQFFKTSTACFAHKSHLVWSQVPGRTHNVSLHPTSAQWRSQGEPRGPGPPPILQTKHKRTFKLHKICQICCC